MQHILRHRRKHHRGGDYPVWGAFSGLSTPGSYDTWLIPDELSGLDVRVNGKMYFCAVADEDSVRRIDLSTAWDPSTDSAGPEEDVSTENVLPVAVRLSADGTKMYVLDLSDDTLHQYTLSTPWDPSTSSYDSKSHQFTEDNTPWGVAFKPDGTKLYMLGDSNDTVYQYSMSVAWDISTLSYDSKSFAIGTNNSWRGMQFHPNGDQMMLMWVGSTVERYSLSTAWDVSTASFEDSKFVDDPHDWSGMDAWVALDGSGVLFFVKKNTGSTSVRVYKAEWP